MNRRADRWIRRTTIGCVAMLALIAGTVSYLHTHLLVELHGQPGWVAALTPLSVDGMIVAASTTLLADSRSGGRGGLLPWALLVVGSMASLTANVAVAEPTATARVIAAWPSFALIGSYELLTRQVRAAASLLTSLQRSQASSRSASDALDQSAIGRSAAVTRPRNAGQGLKSQAWRWALAHRDANGNLPSGRAIADRFGRHERWGRLVKQFGSDHEAGIDTQHLAT
jgi:Protein of unknown function (DUF2637)